MPKPKTELVAKSNRLIEASYRLGLVEQQIVLYAICRAREEQKGLGQDQVGLFQNLPLTIRAADFAAQFSTGSGTVYDQLKDALSALYSRSVTIHDTHPETGKARVTETRWISDKSYVDGAGIIEFTFAPLVIPYITRLGEDGEFTSYRLEKIGKFSSGYAVRLYEMLVQHLSLGKREVEVAWLRTALCLDGEYLRIVDFKKWVVDVAVAQINEHSDIEVSYTQRKTGRSVTHLDFKIKRKAEDKPKAKKKPVADRPYVEKHARPGESYDQAYRRLAEDAGQQRLV